MLQEEARSRTTRHETEMPTFLTTKDVQDLINVDRSTVYRMAEDGRLPGVKVGRQWRFPANRLAAQLGLDAPPTASGEPAPPEPEFQLGELLEPDGLQSIIELLGELIGLMAVATDMDGRPLTTVANRCGFYSAFAEQPGAAEACLQGWRQLAEQPHVAARFVPTHLGFLCARTFVWVDRRPVGMLVVGGVTPDRWPPDPASLEQIADEVGVAVSTLHDAVAQTYDVDPDRRRWILRELPQFGDLVSRLATARHRLLAHDHSNLPERTAS